MKSFLILAVSLFMFSCAHHAKHAQSDSTVGRDVAAVATSPECDSYKNIQVTKSIITIELLQKLAECKQYDVLNDLYNNQSVHLDSLPRGYSAGKGARVLDVSSGLVSGFLAAITGSQWKGKIFFPSVNPRETRGLNRIESYNLLTFGKVVPMASFVSKLVSSHQLVPEFKGDSLVLLNYAHPVSDGVNGTVQEQILRDHVQVYDLMVAVPGKYGNVFIGKTWLGHYRTNDGEFIANDQDSLIAWYFLDYNQAALANQSSVDQFSEDRQIWPQVNEAQLKY